jgi:regulatory protein YycI of two-component signal transduction system YycFG
MNKRILNNDEYIFDSIARTIKFNQIFDINQILLITNITDNIIIYNFACEGFGGSILNRTLTLEYDTSLMSSTDDLQVVIYEESLINVERNNTLSIIERQTEVLDECLDHLKLCSKYLKKIYNPE